MIGRTISHYQVVEKLGEGGMGEVWKAIDTKLGREVAIKVLPEHLAEDAEHLARFEREAKLLASLNHRNIAAIYGLEEAEGMRFLVMELVEGEDLARRLERGPLATEEAIDICHQLTRALEAAHEKGVLHRDLKPANVQVTHEGRVKVLDFGLAKAFEESAGNPDLSPTLTSAGTKAGVILGTAAYMSPEQARGKPLDKRTDIWSFGCVLFECLAGRSAFRGETVSDTLASILKSAPDWSALPDDTSPSVRELLQRCLQKDPRNRLRDIGDARIELQRSMSGVLTDTSGVAVAAPLASAPKTAWPWMGIAAALLVGALAGALLWPMVTGRGGPGATGGRVARFSIGFPEDMRVPNFLLSPAGGLMAFVGLPRSQAESDADLARLYLRRFDEYEVRPIEGSAGVRNFCFSPDGRWLAVLAPVAPKSSKGRLSKVLVDGGAPPQPLLDWPEGWSGNLVWLPDGDILARVENPRAVVRIPTDGSKPRAPVELRASGFESHFFTDGASTVVMPDGVHVLGDVFSYGDSGYDVHVALLNVDTGEARILVQNGNSARLSPTGHLLFSRGETLLAAAFDAKRMELTGAQVAITDGLRATAIWEDAWLDISRDGTLAHWPGGLVGGSRKLVIIDRKFDIVGEWSKDRRPFEASLTLSRDGRRLAVTQVNAAGLYDTWVSDVDRPRLTLLVKEPGQDCIPRVWAPDGDRLVVNCQTAAKQRLYLHDVDGAGEPELLLEQEMVHGSYVANAFLTDGSALVVTQVTAEKPTLMLLPMTPGKDGSRTPRPLVANASGAQISPDGKWMVYISDSSGRNEVYLRRLKADGTVGRELPVSRRGCGGGEWQRGDEAAGLTIVYGCAGIAYGVRLADGADVRLSDPILIADGSELLAKLRGGFDQLPDGRRIAILQGDDEEEPTSVNVVLSWFSELESRYSASR